MVLNLPKDGQSNTGSDGASQYAEHPFYFMEFKDLARELNSQIKAIAYKHKPQSGYVDNDDLAQEALVSLWKKHKSGELCGKNKSYILKGAYFDMKNYLRKSLNQRISVSLDERIDEQGTSLKDIIADESSLGGMRNKEANMFIDTIRNDGLTSREKDVFEYFLQGLNTRQIGKRLGISHVRVVKLENNIWKKTRAKLKDYDK